MRTRPPRDVTTPYTAPTAAARPVHGMGNRTSASAGRAPLRGDNAGPTHRGLQLGTCWPRLVRGSEPSGTHVQLWGLGQHLASPILGHLEVQ
ncbi:MAG: hypothetical protein JWN91_887 [Nocardioides sp.]|nr:hypothetical protein [Nocardioides sp.]